MSAPQIAAPGTDTDLGSIAPATFRPPGYIRETGAVEPYPRAERWATVTALPNAPATGPVEPVAGAEDEPLTGQDSQEGRSAPRGGRASAAVDGTFGHATESEVDALDDPGLVVDPAATAPDPEPTPPERPPRSWLRHATVVGYWMSVLVGAAGQIWSLGALINQGPLGYVAAGLGAAFAEVTMIGAGKWARENRMDGKPWKLLLVLAGIVCAYATCMNAIHWLKRSVGMAITFAGGSAMGFAVETTIEQIDAAHYTRNTEKYEDDLRRWQNRQKSRSATASTNRASKASKSASSTTAKSTKASSDRAPKTVKGSGTEELKREIVAWARQHRCGAKAVRKAFRGRAGLPSLSTIKRWLGEVESGKP